MKKNILYILILIVLVGFMSPVYFVSAEDYKLLAPLPCEKGTTGCTEKGLETFDPTGDNKIGVNAHTIQGA